MKRSCCPYCNCKNIYLKRTSPMEQYGCRDCEEEIKLLREHDIDETTIRKVFARRKAKNKHWRRRNEN